MSNGRTTINWDIQPEKHHGLSTREIARLTGLSRSTVSRRLTHGQNLDIPPTAVIRSTPVYDERKPEGMRHMSWREIGERYGLSETGVKRRRDKGIPFEWSNEEAYNAGRMAWYKKMKNPSENRWNDNQPFMAPAESELCRQMSEWQKAMARAA